MTVDKGNSGGVINVIVIAEYDCMVTIAKVTFDIDIESVIMR